MEHLFPDVIVALFAEYDCIGLLTASRGLHSLLTPVAQNRALLISKTFLRCAFYRGVRNLIAEFSSIDNLVESQHYPKRLKVILYVINLEHQFTKPSPVYFYFLNGQLICFQRRNTKGQVVTETHFSLRTNKYLSISKAIEYFRSGTPSRVLDYKEGAEYAYRRDGTIRFKRFTANVTFYYDSKGTETARENDYRFYTRAPHCIRDRRILRAPTIQRPESQSDDTS